MAAVPASSSLGSPSNLYSDAVTSSFWSNSQCSNIHGSTVPWAAANSGLSKDAKSPVSTTWRAAPVITPSGSARSSGAFSSTASSSGVRVAGSGSPLNWAVTPR